ncbi:hypothetical protein EMQ25_13070 [Arsenicitalea aurantiaca]|uniref:SH3b domain-containing protein n=1 Tax=Arsenicitalea aurantiaca TaxID=1783274 RepID=A0A433X8S1_9HYPH|nr:hypothetical protein EMQ25_13070 [Arsenicitalea aurantiaca]
MIGPLHAHVPRGLRRPGRAGLRAFVALVTLLLGVATATLAFAQPTGLPLPRFVTTRSNPINVRVGPGTRYGVAWVYVRPGTPVEVIQEFDTWRKVRDVDGSEGWIHQNLLSGNRAAIVAPWRASGETVPLLARGDESAPVRAHLPPGFRVELSSCDGRWCEVRATDHPESGRGRTFTGMLAQSELWGAYVNEVFD